MKLYCQKRNIKIGYVAPYIYKKNVMAEKCWRMLTIMKDVLLINSGIPVSFWAKAIDISNYLRNKHFAKCFKCTVIPKKTWTGNKQDV